MTSSHVNTGIFVVPDDTLVNMPRETGILVANLRQTMMRAERK